MLGQDTKEWPEAQTGSAGEGLSLAGTLAAAEESKALLAEAGPITHFHGNNVDSHLASSSPNLQPVPHSSHKPVLQASELHGQVQSQQ